MDEPEMPVETRGVECTARRSPGWRLLSSPAAGLGTQPSTWWRRLVKWSSRDPACYVVGDAVNGE